MAKRLEELINIPEEDEFNNKMKFIEMKRQVDKAKKEEMEIIKSINLKKKE